VAVRQVLGTTVQMERGVRRAGERRIAGDLGEARIDEVRLLPERDPVEVQKARQVVAQDVGGVRRRARERA
jgi:hypothetical protein